MERENQFDDVFDALNVRLDRMSAERKAQLAKLQKENAESKRVFWRTLTSRSANLKARLAALRGFRILVKRKWMELEIKESIKRIG